MWLELDLVFLLIILLPVFSVLSKTILQMFTDGSGVSPNDELAKHYIDLRSQRLLQLRGTEDPIERQQLQKEVEHLERCALSRLAAD